MRHKFIILCGLALTLLFFTGCGNYTYVGKITDISSGGSSNLILDIDTIGKTPYTANARCSNMIRINQSVFTKDSDNYLWVEYAPEKFC